MGKPRLGGAKQGAAAKKAPKRVRVRAPATGKRVRSKKPRVGAKKRRERVPAQWKVAVVAGAIRDVTGAPAPAALARRLAAHPQLQSAIKPPPDPKHVYGCYLLQNGRGATYVGMTYDFAQRLREHNGELAGGAAETAGRGPWRLVATVHGFPSRIEALQFEYRWQRPHRFAALQPLVPRARAGHGKLERRLAVMHALAAQPEWTRLRLRTQYHV